MNPYTSMWTGVTPGDGPQAFHLVLLDNGRTDVLADAVGRQALRCIRCSACLNVCPVYERTGGQAYGSVYPGPIGAILTPQLRGIASTGRRADRVAAVRLVAVRRLLRRLPGRASTSPRCSSTCAAQVVEHRDGRRGSRPPKAAGCSAAARALRALGAARRARTAARARRPAARCARAADRRAAGPGRSAAGSARRDLPAPAARVVPGVVGRTDGGRRAR